MSKYVKMTRDELGKVKEYLQQNMEDATIAAITGIVIDPAWAYTQEWYKSMYCNLHEIELEDEEDYSSVTMEPDKMLVPPRYLVRYLEDSNTGYDILIDLVDDQYVTWGEEDTPITLVNGTVMTVECTEFYGSAPAYQGCYGDDPEAKEWVKDLYKDAEAVWL